MCSSGSPPTEDLVLDHRFGLAVLVGPVLGLSMPPLVHYIERAGSPLCPLCWAGHTHRIVIVISKLLKPHSKAKRRAPAYSRALRQIRGVFQRIVRGRLRPGLQKQPHNYHRPIALSIAIIIICLFFLFNNFVSIYSYKFIHSFVVFLSNCWHTN